MAIAPCFVLFFFFYGSIVISAGPLAVVDKKLMWVVVVGLHCVLSLLTMLKLSLAILYILIFFWNKEGCRLKYCLCSWSLVDLVVVGNNLTLWCQGLRTHQWANMFFSSPAISMNTTTVVYSNPTYDNCEKSWHAVLTINDLSFFNSCWHKLDWKCCKVSIFNVIHH